MRRIKTIVILLALLAVTALLFGCGSANFADNVSPTPKPTATEKPSPTESPAPAEEDAEQTAEAEQAEETEETEVTAAASEEETGAEGTTLIIDSDDGDQAPQTFTEGQERPRYKVIRSDLSWSRARAACWDQGGYLAVISSSEELDEIAELAEDQGLVYVWIGCHREDKTLVWETDETVDFFKWAGGEPSEIDSYDFVREDFIMMKRVEDHWYYNDNRDDPAGVFPEFYSGVMGYVCEFDG